MSRFLSRYLRYTGILLFAFVLPLPIPLRVIAFFFILMLLNILFLKRTLKIRTIVKDRFFLFFFLFFLIDILRFLVFENFTIVAFKEVKLPFALIPFLFMWKKDQLILIKKEIFISFTLGVLTYIIYAWSYAAYFYTIKYPHYEFSFFDGYVVYLLDYHLPGSVHEAYIGIYMAFVGLVIYSQTIVYRAISFRWGIMGVLFFSFNIFYIGSKSVLFLFLALLIGVSIYTYRKDLRNKMFYKVIGVLAIIISSGCVFMMSWLPVSIKSSIEKRIVIYDCVGTVALEHYLIGVGYKNLRSSSVYCDGYEGDLITHNIFFNEFIANGVFGLVTILLIFSCLFKTAMTRSDILLGSLTVLFLGVGLVEDVFNRQWGVMFFVFFVTIMYLKNEDITSP